MSKIDFRTDKKQVVSLPFEGEVEITFAGVCPFSYVRLYVSSGSNDPRGPLGKHAVHSFDATEYDMVGPSLYVSWIWYNDAGSAGYEKAITRAKLAWWKPATPSMIPLPELHYGMPFQIKHEAMAQWWEREKSRRVATWKSLGSPVPDVGDIVYYGLDSFGLKEAAWRVTSWYRYDERGRLRNALPENATHLGLYAICGAVVPIGECQPTGGSVDKASPYFQSEKEQALASGKANAIC